MLGDTMNQKKSCDSGLPDTLRVIPNGTDLGFWTTKWTSYDLKLYFQVILDILKEHKYYARQH